MTITRTVHCILPRHEDYPDRDLPPEHLGEEWAEGETCSHPYCLEVDGYRRSAPTTMTRDERQAIESDHELMADEFHGRGLDGDLRW